MTRSDPFSSFCWKCLLGGVVTETSPTLSPTTQNRIDPATGIKPIVLWGPECARGWVSDARFGPGDAKVIKRKPCKRRPANAGY